jgi:predicted DNA-binding mobile mystery protein A
MERFTSSLTQRHIDKLLKILKKNSKLLIVPQSGWIKVIREALFMNSAQLSKRLGISPSAVRKMEQNEEDGKITLETLKKAAEQLDCHIVYFFVPKTGSLKNTIKKQATKYAKEILDSVSHSMNLEDQAISEEEKKRQLEELIEEILFKKRGKIWDKL